MGPARYDKAESEPATVRQRRFATELGIEFREDISKAEISRLITKALETREAEEPLEPMEEPLDPTAVRVWGYILLAGGVLVLAGGAWIISKVVGFFG